MVEIKVKDFGTIKIVLDRDKAPNTCANFCQLARAGFYDGLTFHRIIKNFMIQGGDPLGSGTGGPGYTIKGEFMANGFAKNDLSHKRGVISMARTMQPDTAGSQFFICDTDDEFLDCNYAAFGHIVPGDKESFMTLDKIASVATDANDMPLSKVVMEKVTVSDDEPVLSVAKIR